MKKFIYHGPVGGVTLDDGTEIMFHPNKEVDAPEGNRYIKQLIRNGFLKEVPSSFPTKKTAKAADEKASTTK